MSKKLTEERQAFVDEKISELIKMAKLVSVSEHIVLSRDAKDDHYLSLCKKIGADFLITGDKDLLDIPQAMLRKKRYQNPHYQPPTISGRSCLKNKTNESIKDAGNFRSLRRPRISC